MGSLLLFIYQKSALYNIMAFRSAQKEERYRQEMSLSLDGFSTKLVKHLPDQFTLFCFLLPMLFIGYSMQFYNAKFLFNIYLQTDEPWQLLCSSFLFCVLGCGNMMTIVKVLKAKWKSLAETAKIKCQEEE